ncbi:MAG: choice-of-anchor D domain-containing protein, partial [Acidobacteriaceae bacterium]|nr:choice-of-anchor D domain-containing protein [Acidobacteriaceae bacterium]
MVRKPVTLSRRLGVLTALLAAVFCGVSRAETVVPAAAFGQVAVGASTQVTVSFSLPAQISAPSFQLSFGSDYSLATPSCNANWTSCSIVVTFTPQAAGTRNDEIVVAGSGDNVIAAMPLQGTGLGALLTVTPGASSHYFSPPGFASYVAVDNSGTVYYSDSLNSQVQAIRDGTPVLVAGLTSGLAGYSGDGGPATNAQLNGPGALAFDSGNNLYIADQRNHVVRKVDMAAGMISTVAGTGVAGFSGDGGPATAAQLSVPAGLAVYGSTLYVSDSANGTVRAISLTSGRISTYAGTGSLGYSGDGGVATSATLNYPVGLATDISGNLFIADSGNNVIREVAASSGLILTFAGNGSATPSGDGHAATAAGIGAVQYLAIDAANNLYLAEGTVRRIDGGGIISTVTSLPSTSSNIAIDQQGNIYALSLLDIQVTPGTSAKAIFPNTAMRHSSTPISLNLANIGNAALVPGSISVVGTNANDFSLSNGCPASIAAGADCSLAVTFSPQKAGQSKASLRISGATSSPVLLPLLGTGTGIPLAVLNANSIAFGFVPVLTASSPQVLTLSNPGTDTLNVSISLPAGSGFNYASSCAAIPAGGSCQIGVTFQPTTIGGQSATLTLTDNADSSPQTVSLSGTGTAIAQLSVVPSGVSILAAPVSGQSLPIPYVVENVGTTSGRVVSIATSGTNANDFSYTSNCIGTTLVPGNTCMVWVTFKPTVPGAELATLNFSGTNLPLGGSVALYGVSYDRARPAINVDSPGNGATVSGTITVSGWAIADRDGIDSVAIYVDSAPVAYTVDSAARPDVCNAFPNQQSCPNVGWTTTIDTTLLADGVHTLQAVSTSWSGRHAISGPKQLTVANLRVTPASTTLVSIDAPSAAPQSGAIAVTGWALSTVGTISKLSATVDGSPYGQITPGLSRASVCANYPGVAGCPNIGWSVSIDTTGL